MRKSIKLWLGTLIMVLLMGIMLTSCPQPTDGSTYTVLTRRGNASDVPTLQDEYYFSEVLTDDEFNFQVSTDFYRNATHNNWNANEIKAYFIGLGFSSDIANDVVTTITSNKHVEIGSRSGAYIYWLLK